MIPRFKVGDYVKVEAPKFATWAVDGWIGQTMTVVEVSSDGMDFLLTTPITGHPDGEVWFHDQRLSKKDC